MAQYFTQAAEACRMELHASDIKGHNDIGPGERYHAPVRLVYNVIRLDDPSLHPPLALRLAVKEINGTMVPNVLALCLLVYGRLPRFCGHEEQPTQVVRRSTVSASLAEAS